MIGLPRFFVYGFPSADMYISMFVAPWSLFLMPGVSLAAGGGYRSRLLGAFWRPWGFLGFSRGVGAGPRRSPQSAPGGRGPKEAQKPNNSVFGDFFR